MTFELVIPLPKRSANYGRDGNVVSFFFFFFRFIVAFFFVYYRHLRKVFLHLDDLVVATNQVRARVSWYQDASAHPITA